MTSPQAACAGLSPAQVDAIFFPGSGGKPTQAKLLCATCPLIKACLDDSIKNGLEGFYAGTTAVERKQMARAQRITVRSMNEVVADMIHNRKRLKTVAVSKPADTLDYLDTLAEPIKL